MGLAMARTGKYGKQPPFNGTHSGKKRDPVLCLWKPRCVQQIRLTRDRVMQPTNPPSRWYPLQMRVKDRFVRQLKTRLYWYGAKRFYTSMLQGPGGVVERASATARRISKQRRIFCYPQWPSPDYE